VALGGLVVSVLASGPTGYSVEDGGFFRVIKIRNSHFLRRGRFTVCKRTLHSMSEMICRPNFLTCFSPASPASLPDGSGCWIRLIRKPVLWQQVSHLLHKYTEWGYETVLTAACARQGCSATEWVSEWVYFYTTEQLELGIVSNTDSAQCDRK
jgi:hypothetical protein